jgi:hypothetical protein
MTKLTITNDWQKRTYWFDNQSINDKKIVSVTIEGIKIPARFVQRHVEYSDHGHTYGTNTVILQVWIETIEDWIDLNNLKLVTAIEFKE